MKVKTYSEDISTIIIMICISLSMLACGIAAVVTLGKGALESYSFLRGFLGFLGVGCILGALIVSQTAINDWLNYRKESKILNQNDPLRRVRFSSPVEIHEISNGSIDSDYESLYPEYEDSETENNQKEQTKVKELDQRNERLV